MLLWQFGPTRMPLTLQPGISSAPETLDMLQAQREGQELGDGCVGVLALVLAVSK